MRGLSIYDVAEVKVVDIGEPYFFGWIMSCSQVYVLKKSDYSADLSELSYQAV